ncbi:MAG: 16S rRNA (guanine(966)-N(2))-methyltransferase RsmD [Candidatus Firestonebacteria bacterium]|nr:16S rRNA (guanine(966)-N(2))-methyltransferase RsmD [Candidatus Firestonebacteria bacterium]
MQRIIGGNLRHRYLKKIDHGYKIRPTSDKVREALFNILDPVIADSRILDLFAGTGAIGIEALSRGAKLCIFIENNIKHFKLIKENLEYLGLNEGEVYLKNTLVALKILYEKKQKFDIIFLDPPYFHNFGLETLKAISNYEILNLNGIVIWEHEKKEQVPNQIGSLHLKRQNSYGNIKLSFFE